MAGAAPRASWPPVPSPPWQTARRDSKERVPVPCAKTAPAHVRRNAAVVPIIRKSRSDSPASPSLRALAARGREQEHPATALTCGLTQSLQVAVVEQRRANRHQEHLVDRLVHALDA